MKQILLSVLLLILMGCELFDKPEKVPSYLKVDGYTFTTNYSTQGSSSSNIKDCWVYINDDLLGVYEMPFEIPILEEGNQKLTILPGIILNGISETRDIYSFMKRYETNINFEPYSSITVEPSFEYEETVNFWLEDFEDPSVKLTKDFNSDKSFILVDSINDPNVFERKYCGKVELNESENYFRVVTNELYDLPTGKDVFLELDYMNTNSLLIGVIVATSAGESYYPFLRLNASEESDKKWKKVYLQLRENISSFPNASYYKIFFEAELDEGMTNTEIYVDNIKVAYPN